MAEQSHSHQKCEPHKNRRFFPIAHLPQDASPMNEWKFFSFILQLLDPKATALSLALPLDKSKSQISSFNNLLVAWTDSSSSAGCIRIRPIPLLLQSAFKKVSFSSQILLGLAKM